MLSASEALALIHAELGEPPLEVLEESATPTAFRSAISRAAGRADGGLLAVFSAHPRRLVLARLWLSRDLPPRAQVRELSVAEGSLLLVHLGGTGRRRAPPPTPAVAWRTGDARPVAGATEHELDDSVLRLLLDRVDQRYEVQGARTADERYLGRRGILAEHEGQWRPTVAALLVAGHRPEIFLPGYGVEILVDGEMKTMEGALATLLRKASRCAEGVDPHILGEVVANALLHRDWASGEKVRVCLDGERLTVAAPGRLPKGAPSRAVPGNPLLMHFASALRLGRGEGQGLKRVAKRLALGSRRPYSLLERDGEVLFLADIHRKPRRSASPLPVVQRLPVLEKEAAAKAPVPVQEVGPPPAEPLGPVVVEVPSRAPVVHPAPLAPGAAPAAAATPEPVPPSVVDPLEPLPSLLPRDPGHRAEALLVALRARGEASTRELASALGCSRPVVGKVLAALVEDGRVKATAAGRSPFQTYVVVEPPES